MADFLKTSSSNLGDLARGGKVRQGELSGAKDAAPKGDGVGSILPKSNSTCQGNCIESAAKSGTGGTVNSALTSGNKGGLPN